MFRPKVVENIKAHVLCSETYSRVTCCFRNHHHHRLPHGLGRLICSGIDALPSFPWASKVSSSSRFVAEGVFRQSGVVRSFKVADPVLFVFGSHVLYSRGLQFFPYDFASYFTQPCVSRNTSYRAHLLYSRDYDDDDNNNIY